MATKANTTTKARKKYVRTPEAIKLAADRAKAKRVAKGVLLAKERDVLDRIATLATTVVDGDELIKLVAPLRVELAGIKAEYDALETRMPKSWATSDEGMTRNVTTSGGVSLQAGIDNDGIFAVWMEGNSIITGDTRVSGISTNNAIAIMNSVIRIFNK